MNLLSGDTARISVEQSISYLDMSARIAPQSAAVLADLSAAHLVRASITGDAWHLLAAVEAASTALQRSPMNRPALYNRALALDLMSLNAAATIAWRAYIKADGSSQYAREARDRLAVLAAAKNRATIDDSSDGISTTLYDPSGARALAWDTLLGSWGSAILEGDSVGASRLLERITTIAQALATKTGDSLTVDAVNAIETSGRSLEPLARAHMMLARGQARAQRNDYRSAQADFDTIRRSSPSSAALMAAARLSYINSLIYTGSPDAALVQVAAYLEMVDADRYPVLLARALWIYGVLLLRSNRIEPGLASIARAKQAFERVSYATDAAGALGIEGEVLLQSGDRAEGYRRIFKALFALKDTPEALWRHNVLVVLARAADRDGLHRAAHALEEEDALVASRASTRVSLVETFLARARSDWAAGDTSNAQAAFDMARTLLDGVPDASAREQLGHELRVSEARMTLISDQTATAHLDSAVGFFSKPALQTKLLVALLTRGSLHARSGRYEAAERDLSSAALIYDSTRAQLRRSGQKQLLLAQAKSVFDSLVAMQLRAGRPNEALRTRERGRQAFSEYDSRSTTPSQGRADEPVIEFAILGDRLQVWVLLPSDTVSYSADVDGDSLSALIQRTRTSLEIGVPDSVIVPDLAALFDLLVRPIGESFPPRAARLAIIADGELALLPFAALRDTSRDTYLFERYAIRYSGSLSDAMNVGLPAQVPSSPAFAMGPALDRATFPSLPDLPGAHREVVQSAAFYEDARTVERHALDSAGLVRLLPSVDLFHFAGHAIVADAEPERSRLAIPPRGLTAAAIADLPLKRLRLVVLSACETSLAPSKSHGGFAGFSEAFLAAGAGGVIGSTWKVGDRSTADLMVTFHNAYSTKGNAALALQHAQLSALGTTPIGTWAAFRYIGY